MQGNRTLPKHWLRTARKCTLLGALAGTAIWAAAPTPPSFTPSLWVNPLVGTAADGQTFPAAGVPFAMTQWTPQTRAGEAKCVAPYYYDSTRFQGFRGSHFLSGSCTQEYGSMTVMPMRDASHLDPQQWAENYTHATEHASPFLYTVDLPSSGIRAEVTGTERSGMMRFRFAAGTHVGFLGIEDNIRKATGVVHIDPARGEVTLTNPVTRIYQGNGKPAGFSAYYVLQFNQPFTIGGTYTARSPGDHATDSARRAHRHTGRRTQIGHNGPAGGYISFVLPADRTIILRVGTSFTSLQEARRNLAAEIPDFDFDHIVSRAREAWDSTLGRIVVDDDSPARITFYTALYHCLLLPRIFSDSDGSYPRFAGNGTIEHANGFTFYTDYSLWDTFRALHPLLTIVAPQRAGDMVRSLIAMGQQGGFLPIFPAWNSYTSEMVGDHADAVIADAFAKHLSGFDAEQAYKLMRRNATVTPDPALYKSGHGRRALADYERLGYIPLENKVRDAYHHREQVSRTLEYAYDDSLVGAMASALGHAQDAILFGKRAQNWRNVFDASTGFVRGRHADGQWAAHADPAVPQRWITEGLPFQDTFFVPQDIAGLIAAEGGNAGFTQKLDELFDRGLYDQGNEPSHHIAYLYDYAGEPAKTQGHIRALRALYKNAPDGLPGNDDAGQMSAWYVFSALGFYPVSPGTPSYALGVPLFSSASITMGSGMRLHIEIAPHLLADSDPVSASLNGQAVQPSALRHADLLSGGTLRFEPVSR